MILTVLNSMSVLFCIYVLVSKKYKTDDKRVTLLFLCLNVIFMRRLWLVLDPSYTVTVVYTVVNLVAFIALYLISSLVKKDIVIDKSNMSRRIYCILRPIKTKYNAIIRYFKQIKENY